MPTYVYETTDPTKPVRRFEVRQSMKDEPLRVDPETGEAGPACHLRWLWRARARWINRPVGRFCRRLLWSRLRLSLVERASAFVPGRWGLPV